MTLMWSCPRKLTDSQGEVAVSKGRGSANKDRAEAQWGKGVSSAVGGRRGAFEPEDESH